ncbi:MAG: hypothetical protein JXA18_16665 [Chitinispirillaceae bacterium]|nr:hypothetical protein [Chitinispirillaceae bacterium]
MAGPMSASIRQAGTIACLFCFITADPVRALPDRTLAGYAGRCAGATASDSFSSAAATPQDSPGPVRIIGRGGYDLVYRERSIDSAGTKRRDLRADAFGGLLLLRLSGQDQGVQAGIDFSRCDASWRGEEYSLRGGAVHSLNRILLGGWGRRDNAQFDCQLSLDPWYCGKAARSSGTYREKGALLWNSPALDLSATAALSFSHTAITTFFRNGSPFAASGIIANRQNSARRIIPLSINGHQIGCTIGYSGNGVDAAWEGIAGLIGGAVDTGAPAELPLSVRGAVGRLAASVAAKRLPNRPRLRLSSTFLAADVEGFDPSGERFLRLIGNSFAMTEGGIDLHTGTRGTAGPVASFVSVKGGEGSVALYPFTQWLYILDLPDRLKLYAMTLTLAEAGLYGCRRWKLSGNHIFTTDITLTGCRLYGSIDYAEQVRYMGVLPVYEDRTNRTLADHTYVVIKAALNYFYTLKAHEMFISMQQLLPIEIPRKGHHEEGSGRAGMSKRTLYGGMRIECGVAAQLGPANR